MLCRCQSLSCKALNCSQFTFNFSVSLSENQTKHTITHTNKQTNINEKKNQKQKRKQNAVYSEKHRRNEYGIGDQCRIYWPLLSAGSDSTNHCVANGKIMSRKGIMLWSNSSGRTVLMLLWTDYWWVRPTKQTQTNKNAQLEINSLVFHLFARLLFDHHYPMIRLLMLLSRWLLHLHFRFWVRRMQKLKTENRKPKTKNLLT